MTNLTTYQKMIIGVLIGVAIVLLINYIVKQNKKQHREPSQKQEETTQQIMLDLSGYDQQDQVQQKYLVLFFTDWCGGCNQFKPIWDEVEKNYNGSNGVQMVKINGDEQRDLLQKHGVSSIPNVKMCYGSIETPSKVVDFKDDRTMENLVAFMNSN